VEEIMTIEKLLEQTKKFEVDAYKRQPDFITSHISFTGTPEKHPYDADRIILIPDPLSANISYYEFATANIEGVEELTSLVTIDGKSIRVIRIWVKKGSIGVRSTPFIVEDTMKR
jgi:inorganic pyrophosphatase